ncbi:hypothetical protein CCACVL1_00928 [Corchorus capsularis]|uniref:Uncharacterized protein n=1 Tax=Corchorus capsularis TaxID=210143 RepID=A0A1R3KTT8_COCAP|nr:hypothetical protein CCACVL1_00928 [Corchorus capsularis]
MPRRSGTTTVWVRASSVGQRRPHVARVAKTVQQDHRRPAAAHPHKQGRPVSLHVLVATTWRIRLHLRLHNGRHGQQECNGCKQFSHGVFSGEEAGLDRDTAR